MQTNCLDIKYEFEDRSDELVPLGKLGTLDSFRKYDSIYMHFDMSVTSLNTNFKDILQMHLISACSSVVSLFSTVNFDPFSRKWMENLCSSPLLIFKETKICNARAK